MSLLIFNILSFPVSRSGSSSPLPESHRAPATRARNPLTSTLGRPLCATPAPAPRNVPSPPPTPGVFLKATASNRSSPGVACVPGMWLGWPLNRWPQVLQTLRFQALFCGHPPGADRAIPPGFCPFQSPLMGCFEQSLSSISNIISERGPPVFKVWAPPFLFYYGQLNRARSSRARCENVFDSFVAPACGWASAALA